MAAGLIDTHAHLTFEALACDLPGVLARCAEAGVSGVITVGTDMVDSRRAIELAEQHEPIWAAVGIHPHEAAKVDDQAFAMLGRLLGHPKVVAVGEMGLDYHYDFSDRDSQWDVFRAQLALARNTDLPVIIHCREAVADTVRVLLEGGFEGRRVVFHCFTGSADEARLVAEHGWRISFTGIVTFRNSQALQSIARDYPGGELMLETDAPYLSPEPVRKARPNEPAHVQHTAAFLARLRGEPVDRLIEQTSRNARSFFGLKADA